MRLLVSVVATEEVAAAVRGGADIIDVKNPAEGALGASVPHIIRQVRAHTPASIPVSATLGDLPHLPGTAALAALGAASCGIQFVKVGLMGSRNPADAIVLLRDACQAVRDHNAAVQIIACGYADGDQIGALPPHALPAVAIEAGADGCLLDTYRKGNGTLVTCLTDGQLRRFVIDCRQAGLLCALAGSLTVENLPLVSACRPDIIGVRTAACQGGRVHGRVDAQRVQRIKSLLHGSKSL
jgi:(5-formylfuran-3-yl)methyl phosphate synthase